MISINMSKAKEIGHTIRREKRAEEFAPLDIQATIPSLADLAEQQRQVIRDKYSSIQDNIINANTPEDIKEALGL